MVKYIARFALLILVISILILLITGNFLSESPLIITGQLLCVGFNIWARRSFQKNQFSIHQEPLDGSLLTIGPYKYVRHPMYTSVLFLVWISISVHLSILSVSIAVVVTLVTAIRIVSEEKLLSLRFPDYPDYKLKTKAVIPFLF
ncbi:MAG TPA: methyltransferase [Ignavibacteriaceae bacterium]|nr:methyltransferase [Ignavibacteriaceae bacterium]